LLCHAACQVLEKQEYALVERKQAVDAAAAAVERKQQELGAKDASLADAAAKLEHQQAAAAAAAEELERQRKALEAARRGLAGVEAALDAREAQMGESWGQLAANTAALKAGDLDGLSTRATVSLCLEAWGGEGVLMVCTLYVNGSQCIGGALFCRQMRRHPRLCSAVLILNWIVSTCGDSLATAEGS
jgi:hypothetical protein